MRDALYDIRLATRTLVKSRSFALTAVLTLAVCIGANVALFTVIYHVLLQPLRIPDPERIVLVYNSYPKAGVERAAATVPDYFERRDIKAFEAHALFSTRKPAVDVSGTPTLIHTMQVTPSFFPLVRVFPQVGRAFTEDEAQIGRNRVVILSDGLSRQLFTGADPLGRSVRLDGDPHTVVGVMRPGFAFVESDIQAWVPLAFSDAQKRQRYSNNWAYVSRLRPGATLRDAQAQVDALNAANLDRLPETRTVATSLGLQSIAVHLQDDLVRDVRGMLYLIWGGALCVLLIGCVNVASLVLVRSRARLHELATRMALGASRGRITSQLVVESVIVAVVGAIGGLLIGHLALDLFGTMALEELPGGGSIKIDGVVAAYTIAAALLVGLALGVVPTIGGLPTNVSVVLREGGRAGTRGRRAVVTRQLFVIVQVALAFILLVGAGLLLASFRRVMTIEPGFDPEGVVTASVTVPNIRYPDGAAVRHFVDEGLRRMRSMPGVVAAGAATSVPFADDFNQDVLLPEGWTGRAVFATYETVATTGYFEAMRIPLIRGRYFDDRDDAKAPLAVIVDQRLAERSWPGSDPIGKRMYAPSDPTNLSMVTDKTTWYVVIGVVAEVKLRGLIEGVGSTGAYYRAHAQTPRGGITFVVRSAGDLSAVATAMRRQIADIDPQLPVFDVQTMADRTDRSLSTKRSAMLLATAFGFVALFLCAVGIYGVLAYVVSQRTKELGIRMALGSTTGRVFALILREGGTLIVSGFVLGSVGAIALRQTLESQLFGTRFTEPVVLVSATAMLVVVAVAACAIPARRAARVDPLVALRYE